jgi:hypothetical protein
VVSARSTNTHTNARIGRSHPYQSLSFTSVVIVPTLTMPVYMEVVMPSGRKRPRQGQMKRKPSGASKPTPARESHQVSILATNRFGVTEN